MVSSSSKTEMKKGLWTHEEDELLSSYITREGEGGWRTIPKKAGLLRCGKSCRLRWMNYLRPSVKRGHISPDEEDLILRLHRLLGNRWSLIAGRIPGRTDNEIKNYWNTHLSKKLISQGIDPKTHKPLSLPSSSSSLNRNHDFIRLSPLLYRPEAISPNTHENFSNPNSNNSLRGAFSASLVSLGNDQTDRCYGNKHEDTKDVILSNDDDLSSFMDSLINEEMCKEQTPTAPESALTNQRDLEKFNGNHEK